MPSRASTSQEPRLAWVSSTRSKPSTSRCRRRVSWTRSGCDHRSIVRGGARRRHGSRASRSAGEVPRCRPCRRRIVSSTSWTGRLLGLLAADGRSTMADLGRPVGPVAHGGAGPGAAAGAGRGDPRVPGGRRAARRVAAAHRARVGIVIRTPDVAGYVRRLRGAARRRRDRDGDRRVRPDRAGHGGHARPSWTRVLDRVQGWRGDGAAPRPGWCCAATPPRPERLRRRELRTWATVSHLTRTSPIVNE